MKKYVRASSFEDPGLTHDEYAYMFSDPNKVREFIDNWGPKLDIDEGDRFELADTDERGAVYVHYDPESDWYEDNCIDLTVYWDDFVDHFYWYYDGSTSKARYYW